MLSSYIALFGISWIDFFFFFFFSVSATEVRNIFYTNRHVIVIIIAKLMKRKPDRMKDERQKKYIKEGNFKDFYM